MLMEAAFAPASSGSPAPTARDRLLRTAGQLFYAEGTRAVSVDRLLVEAGTTRATFYRHFAGKQDLVLAYVGVVDAHLRAQVDEVLAAGVGPERLLYGIAEEIGGDICGPGFRGCPFLNAAAEHPDADDPVHQAVLAHRQWFHGVVTDALVRSGHPHADAAARQLVMLRDGAMAAGHLSDPDEVRQSLLRGVEELLNSSHD
jgi:AcrR family transcriptional regulator